MENCTRLESLVTVNTQINENKLPKSLQENIFEIRIMEYNGIRQRKYLANIYMYIMGHQPDRTATQLG
jgi:hypothetical protein